MAATGAGEPSGDAVRDRGAGGRPLTLSRRAVAVSPDGTRIAYAADGRIYLRSLADGDSTLVAGADPGIQPAFSPDGESIAFWADPALRRISVHGGVPVTVCETKPAPFGIDWSANGIVFIQPGAGIMRVSPDGGTPEMLVRVTARDGLAAGPQLLPDGDTLLFTLAPADNPLSNFWDKGQILSQSLATGHRKTLIDAGSDGRYFPTGHLVYMVEGTMMTVSFDLRRMQVTSGAVPVVEGIRRSAASVGRAAHYAISSTRRPRLCAGTGQDFTRRCGLSGRSQGCFHRLEASARLVLVPARFT